MRINFDAPKMQELMKSFYILSGIRFVLFDSDFNEVTSYPKESCEFCRLMKGCKKTRRKCNYTDRKSFEKCAESDAPVVYKCHSGLVEAVIPLHENNVISGYLMFGQVVEEGGLPLLLSKVPQMVTKYGFQRETLETAISNVACKTPEQINAAAKIMEACTNYVMYKELVTPENDRIFENAKKYIDEHLGEPFNINDLCETVGTGRTKLYGIFRKEAKMGISEYLKRRRLHYAKKLLKTTDLKVFEISEKVGFNDYTYFNRVYKERYGISPNKYRKHKTAK